MEIIMALDIFSCMKSFVAVVDAGGFSSASRSTHISTSVLTKQIQRLEVFLEKKLLHRTTRRLELTEAGKVYIVYAKKILQEVDQAKDIILDIDQEPHGQITIGIPSFFESVFPMDQLRIFLGKYPKLKLHIIAESSPTALLTGAADLIVSTTNLQDKQLIKEHLFTSRRGIFASPGYIKKNGIPKDLSDLKNHNCLINYQVFPTREWPFDNNKKIKVSGNFESELSFDTFIAATKDLGLVCAPFSMLKEEIKTGRLISIKLDAQVVAVDLFLYYLPTTYNSKIKLIADYMKEYSQKEY
jgi:DNA-binding transcriptional LysR family regulator